MTAYEMATQNLAEAEIQEKSIFAPKNDFNSNYWRGFRDGIKARNFENSLEPKTESDLVESINEYVKKMDKIAAEPDKEIESLYQLKAKLENQP